MAEMKSGQIAHWRRLSPTLAVFHLISENGARFGRYEGGQYMALRRDDCLLTKKVRVGNDVHYVPDLDADGKQKRGPVTHSFSIASAPFETARENYLEFYVVLHINDHSPPGRFTESLFRVEGQGDKRLYYVERIVGDFTLARRAAGFEHVLMVATGTGLAPFISIIKQLHFAAESHPAPAPRYTLLYANRSNEELGFHRELLDIEASQSFDFVYVPAVSRPTARDRDDPRLGAGRANNLLRHVFGIPPREQQAVDPQLPRDRPLAMLQQRIDPSRTVVLTCGNQNGMEDIAWIAAHTGMRFEKEDW